VGRVVRFVKKFDLPCPPSSAILHITADNGYQVWVNGNPVGSAQVAPVPGWATSNLKEASLNSQGWQTVESYTVNPAFFNVGANALEVLAGNEYFDTDDGDPSSGTASNNPAGVIFKLDIEHEDCNSCCMQIKMPDGLAAAGAKVNIRYDNPDKDYGNGDSVCLPKGKDIQWQLKVGGFTSTWKTKPVDCSPLVVTDADYCLMTINIPAGLAAAGAKVNIRYDNPDKDYGNGESVYLPKGIDIQWQLKVGGFTSTWKTKPVDCSPLVVTDDDYCLMTIDIPDDLAAAGAKVNIRYDNPDKDYADGDMVYLPKGIDIQWQLKVGGFTSAWKTKSVDCSPLVVTDADYCLMTIDIPDDQAAAGAKINIRYDNPDKDYGDGDSVYLPKGIDIQWQLKVSGFASAWKTKHVDCTPLTMASAGSCACEVKSSSQGKRKDGGAVLPERSNPNSALGAPDAFGSPWQNFFSLGFGGSIELKFCGLVGGKLTVYEITGGQYPLEKAEVYGSLDGVNWTLIGIANNTAGMPSSNTHQTTFDLGDTCILYVKIVDVSAPGVHTSDSDAFDLDAVCGEPCTSSDSCNMHIDMPDDLAAAGAKVNIRYDNPDKDYGDGDSVILPTGKDIQWQLKVNGFASAWKTKSVDCTPLVVTDADYCKMTINIPAGLAAAGAKVNIRYDSPDKDYIDGDSVYLPKGIDIQWQLKVSGFASAWKTKSVDCTPLVVTDADYCLMTIDMPDGPDSLAAAGAKVNIRYDSPDKDYGDGESVYLPKGIDIQWQLKVSGFASAWKTKSVDCSSLVVTDADYCLMVIQMPDGLAAAGAKVNIRYDSPDKDYGNGDSVYLPKGIDIQWQLKVSGFASAWKTKSVDCNPLVVTDADYCLMVIQMPDGLAAAGAKVNIRYDSPDKDYGNGESVYLPKGIDIQWQLKVSGFASAWKTKPVDCSSLVVTDADYCLMTIEIPDGAKVDIRYDSPDKQYVNGNSVYLPKGISIEWKIYIGGSWSGWQTKNVDCTVLHSD
jgi:Mor family transcriptional regulator